MGCRATVSQYQLAERATLHQMVPIIRNVWRPPGFRNCITTHQYLIRYFFTAVMQFTAAMRSTGLADLPHMAASVCTLQMPVLFSIWQKSEGMAATTIVVSGSNPLVASGSAPSPRPHRRGESPPDDQRHRRDYARGKPTYDDRYRPDYGWERPTYGDTYRPDYGRSDYYWRPEPRTSPFFNPY